MKYRRRWICPKNTHLQVEHVTCILCLCILEGMEQWEGFTHVHLLWNALSQCKVGSHTQTYIYSHRKTHTAVKVSLDMEAHIAFLLSISPQGTAVGCCTSMYVCFLVSFPKLVWRRAVFMKELWVNCHPLVWNPRHTHLHVINQTSKVDASGMVSICVRCFIQATSPQLQMLDTYMGS